MALLAKKTASTLQELEQAITDLRGRQQENEQAQQTATNELIGLMSAQRANDTARAPLVTAHQAAQTATQEAKAALGRHIGKPTEAGFAEKLAAAEQTLSVAEADLKRHDAHFDRQATHQRITALREQLAEMERASGTVTAQKMELARQREVAAEQARKGALVRILSAYGDLLDVFEHDGIAVASMRDDDAPGFHHLLQDLELSQTDIFNMIIAGPGPDGTISDYRFALVEKQAAIKQWLAKK